MISLAFSLKADRPCEPPTAAGWQRCQGRPRGPAAAKKSPDIFALFRDGPRRRWLLVAAACALACAIPACDARKGDHEPVHPYGEEYTGKGRPVNYGHVVELMNEHKFTKPELKVQWLTANTLRIVQGTETSGEISATTAMSVLRWPGRWPSHDRKQQLPELLQLARTLRKINPDVNLVMYDSIYSPSSASLELNGKVAPLPSEAIEQFREDGTFEADLKEWVDASFNPKTAKCIVRPTKNTAAFKLRRIKKRLYMMNLGEEVCVASLDLSELDPKEFEKEKLEWLAEKETVAKAVDTLMKRYGKHFKFPVLIADHSNGFILYDNAWETTNDHDPYLTEQQKLTNFLLKREKKQNNCLSFTGGSEVEELATGSVSEALAKKLDKYDKILSKMFTGPLLTSSANFETGLTEYYNRYHRCELPKLVELRAATLKGIEDPEYLKRYVKLYEQMLDLNFEYQTSGYGPDSERRFHLALTTRPDGFNVCDTSERKTYFFAPEEIAPVNMAIASNAYGAEEFLKIREKISNMNQVVQRENTQHRSTGDAISSLAAIREADLS
eukprot:GHVT01023428.1.p1 GENE.GHVT01023428.1~~GHVT01023428.1.p1  ORF type:complete len:556 (+),score=58.07 GHVT01023428.1:321-1988(+)